MHLSASSDDLGFGHLDIFAVHLVEYDRMPIQVTLTVGDIMLTRPAAKAEFLNEIQFSRYTA
jgi:hypothetical protein